MTAESHRAWAIDMRSNQRFARLEDVTGRPHVADTTGYRLMCFDTIERAHDVLRLLRPVYPKARVVRVRVTVEVDANPFRGRGS